MKSKSGDGRAGAAARVDLELAVLRAESAAHARLLRNLCERITELEARVDAGDAARRWVAAEAKK